jgi:hypothetical protein
MPKRVERQTIEHWRDGECIERYDIQSAAIQRVEDGTCRIVFPPGCIELATGDELHFDADDLIRWLRGE